MKTLITLLFATLILMSCMNKTLESYHGSVVVSKFNIKRSYYFELHHRYMFLVGDQWISKEKIKVNKNTYESVNLLDTL